MYGVFFVRRIHGVSFRSRAATRHRHADRNQFRKLRRRLAHPVGIFGARLQAKPSVVPGQRVDLARRVAQGVGQGWLRGAGQADAVPRRRPERVRDQRPRLQRHATLMRSAIRDAREGPDEAAMVAIANARRLLDQAGSRAHLSAPCSRVPDSQRGQRRPPPRQLRAARGRAFNREGFNMTAITHSPRLHDAAPENPRGSWAAVGRHLRERRSMYAIFLAAGFGLALAPISHCVAVRGVF